MDIGIRPLWSPVPRVTGPAYTVFTEARARLAKEASESLDDWERAHRARIDKILAERA